MDRRMKINIWYAILAVFGIIALAAMGWEVRLATLVRCDAQCFSWREVILAGSQT